MKKSDLKNQMIVECRNGLRYMVVDDIFVGYSSWLYLHAYDDELKCKSCRIGENCKDYDIIKVYSQAYSFAEGNFFSEDKVIWERSEVKEVTMSEVEEKFGCKVKIIKELEAK